MQPGHSLMTMGMGSLRRHRRAGRLLLLCLLVGVSPIVPFLAVAQHGPTIDEFPPIILDVLPGHQFSEVEITAAPGQRIMLTNRDVRRHSFRVDQWGINVNLPTLQPISIRIPQEADVGTDVAFYSDVADDRSAGLTGVIHVLSSDDYRRRQASRAVPNAGRVEERVVINVTSEFTFDPATVRVQPGTVLEFVNQSAIDHNIVIDALGVHEALGPNGVVLVRIPVDTTPGTTLDFYCSLPGHRELGLDGTITVIEPDVAPDDASQQNLTTVRVSVNLRPFVPEARVLGDGWSRVRTGSSTTFIAGELNAAVFPDDGFGGMYVGPDGSRAIVVVMPLGAPNIPAAKFDAAIADVENSLLSTWTVNRVATLAWQGDLPPQGCDVASRTEAIVPIVTLPAGLTTCRVNGLRMMVFVAIEGTFNGTSGVSAADEVVSRVLTGRGPDEAASGTPEASPVAEPAS